MVHIKGWAWEKLGLVKTEPQGAKWGWGGPVGDAVVRSHPGPYLTQRWRENGAGNSFKRWRTHQRSKLRSNFFFTNYKAYSYTFQKIRCFWLNIITANICFTIEKFDILLYSCMHYLWYSMSCPLSLTKSSKG